MIAGVDEVGRGCIAGNVVAAAVIRGQDQITGLADSKKLSPKKRNNLFVEISQSDWQYSIGEASVTEIDELNILNASLLAMDRAISGLKTQFSEVLVDGNKVPPQHAAKCTAVIGGDDIIIEIQAASIMAKVHRDNLMDELHQQYPQYGLNQHKGYPTKAHVAAINKYGIQYFYRTSFAPVKRLMMHKS